MIFYPNFLQLKSRSKTMRNCTKAALYLVTIFLGGLLALACATTSEKKEITGSEYEIDDIELKGVNRFKKKELLEYLFVGETSWLPFTETFYFNEALVPTDTRRIVALYRSYGYYDAEVLEIKAEPKADVNRDAKTALVTFEIRPGRSARIGDIRFRGLHRVPEKLAARVETGYILPYGDRPAAPFNMKYYLCGADSVRGWGLKRLAPKTEICASPGRFQLLGNSFEIESGEITLPSLGDLDPFVHIVAVTITPEAEVTVTVRGRASRPELILTSDPAMSRYQIVSLLVTGRSDTAERGDENVQTQAASLLLAFQNPLLERQLYSRLGVDRVDVALGQSVEEPILIVGKRLGKRWYVETEYHHNAPEDENTAGAHIEYQLSPAWSLETTYGDANKGEVGVYWRKRFDTPGGKGDKDAIPDDDKEE
jgi:hypothetical protein